MRGKRRPGSAWAFAQSDKGFRFLLPDSMDTVESINKQSRLWSESVNAQIYVGLDCSYIAEVLRIIRTVHIQHKCYASYSLFIYSISVTHYTHHKTVEARGTNGVIGLMTYRENRENWGCTLLGTFSEIHSFKTNVSINSSNFLLHKTVSIS